MRRVITVPGFLSAALLLTGLLPPLALAAFLVDLARGSRWVALRTVVFLDFYFLCEALGIVASLAAWLASPAVSVERYLGWNFRLQCWWGSMLGRVGFFLYGVELDADALPADANRPILLLIRHASTADTILPVMLVSAARGIRLRYVLKRELLWDPCLDIVGNRLPNCFVRRDARDSEREIAAVAHLADGVGPGEGVLIYPEGTRFSPSKLEHIVTKLEERADHEALELARQLRGVLPPKVGGALALLAAVDKADVVVCAHRGLEGSASLAALWNGGLVGATVRVRFWSVRSEELPRDDAGRIAWLREKWLKVDRFVCQDG